MALTVFALACTFAFGEIVLRLLYKNETVLFPRYHTDFRYGRYIIRGIRPNAEFWHTSVEGSWKFVTNSKGFRNTKDFNYAKPANTVRVLSLETRTRKDTRCGRSPHFPPSWSVF